VIYLDFASWARAKKPIINNLSPNLLAPSTHFWRLLEDYNELP
jgi:hypothetical protein